MRKIVSIFFVFFLFLFTNHAFATHVRAGEISYKKKPGTANCYIFTVTLFTNTGSFVDHDSIEIVWGDGKKEKIPRVPNQKILVGKEINKETYIGEHCFPSFPLWTYTISVLEPNRMADIINVNNPNHANPINPNSQDIPFYVETTLSNVAFCGALNNSAVLLELPIDFANVGEIYTHNPVAFDIDNDSLSYELIVPMQGPGVPVPLYEFPDSVYSGYNDSFRINQATGEIIWNTPQIAGIYNIAIKISEWRTCSDGSVVQVGYFIRDMQIIVEDVNNNPPVITDIADTCVLAGSEISKYIFANDIDIVQKITLTANGGPLELTANNATFLPATANATVSSEFKWQTNCEHIRKEPWIVVFRAVDDYTTPLADLETWNIRVLAPPPQNLQAKAMGNDIRLTWDSLYQCSSTGKFKGFSIWRREGCAPDSFDICDNGLEGRGYVKIADTIQNYFYIDKNLDRGKVYSYRVIAVFAEGGGPSSYNFVESFASDQDCAELKIDVPIITNVSVIKTDVTDGQMWVRWKKPKADVNNLDTTAFTGVGPWLWKYKVYRTEGFGGTGSNFILIDSFSSPYFATLNDTTLLDSFLNTADKAYSYRIDFFAQDLGAQNEVYIGTSGKASSVYLSISPDDKKLHLSWTYKTPWVNDSFIVYRYDTPLLIWIAIDTVYDTAYTDIGLLNEKQYCYYVQSYGHYSDTNIAGVLINDSEIKCAIPKDTIPPCPPILSVVNYCDKYNGGNMGEPVFNNILIWTLQQNPCSDEIMWYKIYYAPREDTAFTLITSASPKNDTNYVDDNLINTLAGCYYITSLDIFDNESRPGNTVCVDNCPLYDLPNVFTPNGDGHNDYFTPFEFLESKEYAARFIDHINIKIFNRWGQMVFKTEDPLIRWDGKDFRVHKDLAEGVYFYVCEIYELRLKGVQKSDKLKSGYIHILR